MIEAGQSVDAAHRAFLSVRRFACLDGLRFLCIAAVLWHHGPVLHRLTDAPQINTRGFMGVDFFFVLSGFLITTLLLREERAKGRFSLTAFYRRRVLRIVPVYYFVLTAVFLLVWLRNGRFIGWEEAAYYYLFLSNFVTTPEILIGITWSLSVEEQYYVLWPALLLLLPRRILPFALVAAIAVNVAAGAGLLSAEPPRFRGLEFRLVTATYAPILIGSGLALLLNWRPGFAALYRLAGWRGAPVAWFLLLLAVLEFTPRDVNGLPNLAIHLSMALALAALVVRDDNALTPALTWRPVARIGEISYGLYLYHLIGADLAARVMSAAGLSGLWLSVLLYLVFSLVIAEISYRTLESYFLRMKRPAAAR